MLHILLITVLFLVCRVIKHASITHLTLALLVLFGISEFLDGSLLPFVNHVLLSLACIMLFDIVYKTSLLIHQPSDASNTYLAAAKGERWMARPTFREVQGVCMQKTPSVGSEGTPTSNHRGLNNAIDAIKRRLSHVTSVNSSPVHGLKENMSSPGAAVELAEKAASRGKLYTVNTPGKPLREIDPNSPFHIPARDKAKRRSRAQ